MRMHFNLRAFLVFICLFLVEVVIALYVHDKWIRPYMGDLLVVILIYYFVKAFIAIKPLPLILGVFLFACVVEIAQYFNLVHYVGLDQSRFWNVVIGNSFSWMDILAYLIGAICLYLIECVFFKNQSSHPVSNNQLTLK